MKMTTTDQLSNDYTFSNHKEKNFSLKLSSALLFEFETEQEARIFNDAVMTLLCLQYGTPSIRSSLLDMEASDLYTKELV